MHSLCPGPILHDPVQGDGALLLQLWHSAGQVQGLEGEGGSLGQSLSLPAPCS